MRKLVLPLLIALILLVGCVPVSTPSLEVRLETPTNGSPVESLSPVLAWSGFGGATSYRLQVAADTNFQELVINDINLTDITYTVRPGVLEPGKTYYWRVSASKGSQSSGWSSAWRFLTPSAHPTPPPSSKGTVQVSATLDGSPWSGEVNYRVTGPESFSASSAPQSFSDLPAGQYASTYKSGGPAGATLASITPSPSQTLGAGDTIYFTLNFHSQSTSTITVNATLNGSPWSGPVDYGLSGPFMDSEQSVPKTLSNLPAGTYTLTFHYGGPAGATLASISPSPTQNLPAGGAIVYTLNFFTQQATGNIVVSATLDRAPWSGPVSYTISGPFTDSESSVPQTFANVPAGSYTITYNSGGPAGATLASIKPSPMQTLAGGHTIVFNLNFISQQASGTIIVNATLDNAPWQTALGSGSISYTIVGPKTDSGSSIPYTFSDQPAGNYTLSYNSGGPIGATLAGITPSPTQTLAPGGTIVFTLNFHAQAKGIVLMNATLNDQPWSGAVGYVVQGPYVESGSSVPQSLGNAPAGTYSVTYSSGGPEGSVFEGVVPPTQVLSPGGTITFTLRFRFQGVLPPLK
ncbi:MAG: hypothetical protein H8E40_12850 [Chloroflexi bacterium]|nr:hypothetical protein [Chloroflexota bacterium]